MSIQKYRLGYDETVRMFQMILDDKGHYMLYDAFINEISEFCDRILNYIWYQCKQDTLDKDDITEIINRHLSGYKK